MKKCLSRLKFLGVKSTVYLITVVFLLSTNTVFAFKMIKGEKLFEPSSKKPVYGGTLRTTIRAQRTFDPHMEAADHVVPNNCYNTLIRQNPKMDGFEMELAKSYSQPDDLTYVFKLRKGVKFHNIPPVNGREMTSADVKYSIERLTGKHGKKKAQFPHRYYFEGKLASITTPDRYTIVFKTKRPYAPFLRYISTPWASIVPKEAVDKFKNLKRKAIGTGAFTLKEHVKGSHLILAKNPNYFKKGLPYLDKVHVLFSIKPTTNMASFIANELDVIVAYSFMLKTIKEKAPDTTVLDFPGFTMGVLRTPAWIPGKKELKPPFNDVRVRRAISMAMDKKKLVKLGAFGAGMPAIGPIPPVDPYTLTQKDQVEFNPAKAKKLLADAGYPNGFSTTLRTWNAPYMVPPAQVVQSLLKDIGIDAKLQVMEMAQYLNRAYKYKYDMALHVFQAGVDPGEYLSQYFSRTSTSYKWGNKEIWKMIDKQAEIVNPTKRKAYIAKIQRKIMADAPNTFLFTTSHFSPIKPYVHYKFYSSELTQFFMEHYWMEKH